jgi:two-component system nitrogen regulation response regulator NtrX
MLQTMPWPGNVRQLRNVIERVLILGEATARSTPANCPGLNRRGGRADGMVLGGTIATCPARGARAVRTRIPADPDQPLRRQHQPHRQFRRHGTQRPAPQAEVAGRGDRGHEKSGGRGAHFEEEGEEEA